MLKPGSFNIQRKAVVPMLGHLKVDIEVSDNGMKTVEFGKCKESLTWLPMEYWLQYKTEQELLTKINRNLSTYLSSQSMDCVV